MCLKSCLWTYSEKNKNINIKMPTLVLPACIWSLRWKRNNTFSILIMEIMKYWQRKQSITLIIAMIMSSAEHQLILWTAHPIFCCQPLRTFGKIFRHMTCSFQFSLVFRGEGYEILILNFSTSKMFMSIYKCTTDFYSWVVL